MGWRIEELYDIPSKVNKVRHSRWHRNSRAAQKHDATCVTTMQKDIGYGGAIRVKSHEPNLSSTREHVERNWLCSHEALSRHQLRCWRESVVAACTRSSSCPKWIAVIVRLPLARHRGEGSNGSAGARHQTGVKVSIQSEPVSQSFSSIEEKRP